MRYSSMMEDYPLYINKHPEEELTADHLGRVHSCKGEYLSYLFNCYYEETLDHYIGRVRRAKKRLLKHPVMPQERDLSRRRVTMKIRWIDQLTVCAAPVVRNEYDLYHPVEAAVKEYERICSGKEPFVALWWHDEDYISHYMHGRVFEDMEEEDGEELIGAEKKEYGEGLPGTEKDEHDEKLPGAGDKAPSEECLKSLSGRAELYEDEKRKNDEEIEYIPIPGGRYAVFSVKRPKDSVEFAEFVKDMMHYVQKKWIPRHEDIVNSQGYSFQYFADGRAYYYLSLLEEEKEESPATVYGVETWTRFIDEHITENLTVASLATKFHYSPTHFKRVFKYYYKMSVSDYIRKRKLTIIAEKIREGENYQETAFRYGFRTYAGFSRAFEKEFQMSPAAYQRGTFEVIDLSGYYKEYKDSLRLSIVRIRTIQMVGRTILPSKGADVDIPAQINYWLGREFPCQNTSRLTGNVNQKEDKIALWHHNADNGDIEYIMGPVVEEVPEELEEGVIQVTLEGGRYAIFETERLSDEEDVAEVLRRYTRCVFYGWVKENRDMVDLMRITFERYVNGKIYMYVPLK